MDKPKSKDDLRAAGKKRLDEFRQKRHNKAAPSKVVTSSSKIVVDGVSQVELDAKKRALSTQESSQISSEFTEVVWAPDGEEAINSLNTSIVGSISNLGIDQADSSEISSKNGDLEPVGLLPPPQQEQKNLIVVKMEKEEVQEPPNLCSCIQERSREDVIVPVVSGTSQEMSSSAVEELAITSEVELTAGHGSEMVVADNESFQEASSSNLDLMRQDGTFSVIDNNQQQGLEEAGLDQSSQEKYFVLNDVLGHAIPRIESSSQNEEVKMQGKKVMSDKGQEVGKGTWQYPVEDENLTNHIKKIMEEKEQLLSELENYRMDHQHLVLDNNQLEEKLQISLEHLQEMVEDKTICEGKLKEQLQNLIEQKGQLLHDLESIQQQPNEMNTIQGLYGELQTQVITDLDCLKALALEEGQTVSDYFRHCIPALEGESSLMTAALRESNRQMRVINVEKADLVAELASMQQLLDSKSNVEKELMREAEESSKSLHNLNEDNAKLSIFVHTLQQQVEELQGREAYLQEELSGSKKQLEGALVEVGSVVSKVEDLHVQLRNAEDRQAEADRKLEETQLELLLTRRQNEELAQMLEKHENQVIMMGSKEEETLKEIVHMQSQMQVIELEKGDLATRLEDCNRLVQNMEGVETELAEARHRWEKANDERKFLADELNQYKLQYAEAVTERDKLASEVGTAKEDLQRLEELAALFDENRQQVGRMQEEQEALEEEILNLRDKFTESNDRNSQLAAKLDGFAQQSERAQKDNIELVMRLKEMEDELGNLRSERAQLLKLVADAREEALDIREQEAERGAELMEMQSQLQMLKEEKQQLVNDLANQMVVVTRAEKQKVELQEELREVKLQSHQLEDEKRNLLIELNERTQQRECLEGGKAQSAAELQEVRYELQSLQDKKDLLSSELDEHREQILSLQMQLGEKCGHLHMISEENCKLKQSLHEEREAFQNMQDWSQVEHELGEAKAQLQNVAEENGLLKVELQSLQLQVKNFGEREELMNRELEAAEQKVHETEALRSSLETELAALDKLQQETSNEKLLLHEQVEIVGQKMTVLNEEKQQAVLDVDLWKQKWQDLNEEKIHLVTQLEKESQSMQISQGEMVKAQYELEATALLLRESEQKNEQLNHDLETSLLRMEEITKDNGQLLVESERLTAQLMKAAEENARFLQELEDLKHHKQEFDEKSTYSKGPLDLLKQETYSLYEQQQQVLLEQPSQSVQSATDGLMGDEEEKGCLVADLDATRIQPEFMARAESEKAELLSVIQGLKHKITEQDIKHAEKISVVKARLHAAESTTLKLEKIVRETFPAIKLSSSTDQVASGVSKIIRAFEAKGQTRCHDPQTAVSEPQSGHSAAEALDYLRKVIKGADSLLTDQVLHMDIGSELQKLREGEEERACLAGALKQVEMDADLFTEQNRELEKKVALLAEENDRLKEQFSNDMADLQSLKTHILELQNKAAERVTFLQVEVENMQTKIAENTVAFEAERKSYMEALFHVVNKVENTVRGMSPNSVGSRSLDVEAGIELDMASIMKMIEAMEHLCEQLEFLLSESAHNLAAVREEHDWAVTRFYAIHMKLQQLVQQDKRENEEGQQLIERLREMEQKEAGEIVEVGTCGVELNRLFEECKYWLDGFEDTLVEKTQLKATVRELEAVLSTKENDIEELTIKFGEITNKCKSLSDETAQVCEEKLVMEDELKKAQIMYVEQQEAYSRLSTHVHIVADCLFDVCGSIQDCKPEYSDEDITSRLNAYVRILIQKYNMVLKEVEELAQKTVPTVSDAGGEPSHQQQLQDLKDAFSLKEVETSQLLKDVHEMTIELAKTREEKERVESEFQTMEQKLSAVREKLSLAVTKGKGLVQQRDALKQLLAEKIAELERLTSMHSQELQVKGSALQEAEFKLRAFAEAGERVEALESELAYIRNSANALRESFLQKDAILQRLEEVLEDVTLPDELLLKEIIEKVEWLVSTCNETHKMVPPTKEENAESPGISELCASKLTKALDSAEVLTLDLAKQEELDDLNKKYEELLRKYRSMAEQSAMLEQSLLERNFLIQRWEEVLDNIDMPSALRSREPEDRIEWLGIALGEAQALVDQFQSESLTSQTTILSLTQELEESHKQVQMLTSELSLQREEMDRLSTNFKDRAEQNESSVEQAVDLTHETDKRELLEAELSALQGKVFELEASLETKSMEHFHLCADLEAVVSSVKILTCEVVKENDFDGNFFDASASMLLENCVRRLVDKCKASSQEVEELERSLTDLTTDLHKLEQEKKEQALLEQLLHNLQEQLILKESKASELSRKVDEAASTITLKEDEIKELLQQTQSLSEEIAVMKDERDKLKSELGQAEQKLISTREKLSMAVKKGKSVVQQRDAIKQSLDDKSLELDRIKEELQTQSLNLQEAEQRLLELSGAASHVKTLESELFSCKGYAASLEQSLQESNRAIQRLVAALEKINRGGDFRQRDPVEKIEWLAQTLREVQNKGELYEQQAKKSKEAAELLALELEEVQERMDTLTDELMHAEKNMSTLMAEKKAAEAAKADASLRLERAMANLNSLFMEVSSLRESKGEAERENNSLKEAMSAQMEEIRQENLKAEKQNREFNQLQADYFYLKEDHASLMHILSNDMTQKIETMKGWRASAESLAVQLSAVKDPRTESRTRSNSSPSSEERRGKFGLAHNNSTETTRASERVGIFTEGGQHDGLIPPTQPLEEMEKGLNDFRKSYEDVAAAFINESSTISELLIETSNELEFVAQMVERLRKDAERATFLEEVSQEKDRQVLQLQAAYKCVTENAKSVVEELEDMKMQWSMPEKGKISVVDMQSRIEIDSSQGLEQGLENLGESAVDLSNRLASIVTDLSTMIQARVTEKEGELRILSQLQEGAKLQRAEKEREFEDLKSQLIRAQATIGGLVAQQELQNSKIFDLEIALAGAHSDHLTLQKRLREYEGKDASLKSTREELSSLRDLVSSKKQEHGGLMQALNEAEGKVGLLSNKVEELEKVIQQKQALIESLEASRGKALNKLSATLSKLDDLHKLSGGLLAEVEDLHSLLESRDEEIGQLRQEVADSRNQAVALQSMVDVKKSDLSLLQRRLQQVIIGHGIQGIEAVSSTLGLSEAPGVHQLIEVVDKRIGNLLGEAESMQSQLEKKEALLQETRARQEELTGRMNALQAALEKRQGQVQRLTAGASPSNADDNVMASTDLEVAQRSKRIVPLSPVIAAPVLSARKPGAVDHVAFIDIEAGRSNLDAEDDEKGHAFKSLMSSRLVPKATRLLADRLDGFWVAGGRLLMRQPEARLALILYWFAMHVWMLAVFI